MTQVHYNSANSSVFIEWQCFNHNHMAMFRQQSIPSPTNNLSATKDWEAVNTTNILLSSNFPLNPILPDLVEGQVPVNFF